MAPNARSRHMLRDAQGRSIGVRPAWSFSSGLALFAYLILQVIQIFATPQPFGFTPACDARARQSAAHTARGVAAGRAAHAAW